MENVFVVLLILAMGAALASGFPVAFALPGAAILTVLLAAVTGWLFVGDVSAFFAEGGPGEWLSAGVTNLRSVYWEADRDTLIAIPLFVFMGIMLQRSKIADDLLLTMARLFGPVRGGLGISVVFVGGLLAATTGIVGATVVAMGLISLPAMLRHGYSKTLAAGTIAASGTLGQIIPPSIVLIILADQLANAVDQANTLRKALYKTATGELAMPSEFEIPSTSAGELFLGALLPGLLLVGLYMLYILVLALFRPQVAPPVHEGHFDRAFFMRVVTSLVPPLALILLVLGSIMLGVATVNQAGAIGAAGATIMAGYRLWEGRPGAYTPSLLALGSLLLIGLALWLAPVNVKNIATVGQFVSLMVAALGVLGLTVALLWSGWRTFREGHTLQHVMMETAKTSALVFVILMGAAMLTAAFRAFGGEELVRNFLQSLPGGFWTQFFIVNAVIFVLGFFIDFIEIAVVVVPIVTPILLADPSANVMALWFGVMIGVNFQTSFLTPPFGFALFYLRGVAPPEVTTLHIYRGVVPFIGLQLLALAIVGFFPQLSNFLPIRSALTAETAPPPLNPRLQYCIEHVVFREYDQRRAELEQAMARVAALDLPFLPEDYAKKLREGIERARRTFDLAAQVEEARAAIDAAASEYRPLRAQVRDIERQMARIDRAIAALERDLSRLDRGDPANAGAVQRLESRLLEARREREALARQIPGDWAEVRDRVKALLTAEQRAVSVYRRNVDEAWLPIAELLAVLRSGEALGRLADAFAAIDSALDGELETASARVQELRDRLSGIEGTGAIRSALGQVRTALRNGQRGVAAAREALLQARRAYDQELAWRQAATATLLPELEAYADRIRDTIGLRQQPRLPKAVASQVAACLAVHRDLSMWF
ncbi:C4-dicarboxylate TRAP transporter large permease protein DctM [bacterium HR40]|nr:C4-dicarboxylate TRAP transporter large permease protein DctM [bacterium HR40]